MQKIAIALFFIIFIASWCHAQKPSRIEIINARSLEYDQRKSGKVKKLIGDVQFKQGKTLLYCDSAFLFEDSNYVEAYQNVRINDNDSVFMYADLLKYDGDNKKARLERNVRMNDKSMNLTCNDLDFDMNTNTGFYSTGGKIISKENVLTSQVGYYFTNSKEFYARKEVVLVNPDYTMTCDTLKYNTVSHITDFFGPTNIVSKTDKIYCENGWYSTDKEIAQFNKNAIVTNGSNRLKADSIYYEKKTEFGKAFKNIELTDTANKVVIYGDYAELIGKAKRSFVTVRPMAKTTALRMATPRARGNRPERNPSPMATRAVSKKPWPPRLALSGKIRSPVPAMTASESAIIPAAGRLPGLLPFFRNLRMSARRSRASDPPRARLPSSSQPQGFSMIGTVITP